MKYETMIYEEGRIARMIFNRPDKANAFNDRMKEEIVDILDRCDKDPETRVIVVTGASRWFSAGAELTGARVSDKRERSRTDPMKYWQGEMIETDSIMNILKIEKPVIAAINGAAIGLGAELAVACDIKIASEKAVIGFTESIMNLSPVIAIALVPPLVGHSRAKKLLLKGPRSYPSHTSAREAVEMGLFDEVVPAGKLTERTMELAEDIADIPPQVSKVIKRLINLDLLKNAEDMVRYRAHYAQYWLRGFAESHEAGLDFLKRGSKVK